MVIFPYRKDQGGKFYPIITDVKISYKQKVFDIFALIDSGATVSIFKSEVADSLGINIEKGKEISLGGVGGRIKGYIHEPEIQVAGKKFLCPIVFSREYLGRVKE